MNAPPNALGVILTERERARFWSNVDKKPACWNWTGSTKISRADTPYPRFSVEREGHHVELTPRHIAWLLSGREYPLGMILFRTCGNWRCVWPEHMQPSHHPNQAKPDIVALPDALVYQPVRREHAPLRACPRPHCDGSLIMGADDVAVCLLCGRGSEPVNTEPHLGHRRPQRMGVKL